VVQVPTRRLSGFNAASAVIGIADRAILSTFVDFGVKRE
jgi:hypothetical protein